MGKEMRKSTRIDESNVRAKIASEVSKQHVMYIGVGKKLKTCENRNKKC